MNRQPDPSTMDVMFQVIGTFGATLVVAAVVGVVLAVVGAAAKPPRRPK